MANLKVTLLGGFLATSLILSGAMTGCSKKGNSTTAVVNNEKVATVDGTVITKSEYDQTANQIGHMFNMSGSPEAANNPLIQETIKRMTLQRLIVLALLKNDAKKEGIVVTKEEVEKFKNEQIQQVGGPEKFNEFLKANNLTPQEVDAKIEEQLLFNKFIEKRSGDVVKISDKEAQDYYNANPVQFEMPETIQSSHILVKAIEPEMKKEMRAANPKITEDELNKQIAAKKVELKAKADTLYNQVQQNPAQFAEIAKKSSDDFVSAQNGGELGKRSENELDVAFWKALKETKPGTIHKGVVETQFGYHIIKVQDHANKGKASFVEAKKKIVDFLSEKKKKAELDRWFQQKQASAKIVIEPKYQQVDPAAMAKNKAAAGGAPGQAAPDGAPQQESMAVPPAGEQPQTAHQ